jgi:hypothetical protein
MLIPAMGAWSEEGIGGWKRLLDLEDNVDSSDGGLEWESMAGVSGPFLGAANPIRGVNGGGRPWGLEKAEGRLEADGRLKVEVEGLIIPASEGPEFGINPAPFFRAIVSFLTVDEAGNVVTHNIITDPASTRILGDPRNGDAVIEETLVLPTPAIAPIVFVTSPTGSWFAVTDGLSAA